MKLSVSSTLQRRLKALRLDKDGFPMVIIDEYRPVWKKFLQTQVVKDLGKYGAYANLYICSAFISSISSSDKDCWRRASVNIVEQNDITVKYAYSNLRMYMRKYFEPLVCVKQENFVDFEDNDFIRAAIDPVFTGHMICAPKNNTVDKYIANHIPIVFKTFPEELKKQAMLQTLLNSKVNWVPLYNLNGVDLWVGRAKPNYLVFKYKITSKNVLFYGDSSAASIQLYLKTLFEKL